jgi:hypothetical protein
MATAVINQKSSLSTNSVETIDYGIINIDDIKPTAVIEETIPFRIQLTNIMVPGYNANNIPGIGIQVIGYSNYIL